MPLLLRNIALPPGESEENLKEQLLRRFALADDDILWWRVVRKGIDARKKSQIKVVYTVEFSPADERSFLTKHGDQPDIAVVAEEIAQTFPSLRSDKKIFIVGTGPAGLFAAIRLADYGLTATILERGKPVDERLRDVQAFWSGGRLDPESNVQFGEGGAGTFSDGKLTTRLRDPNIAYILEKLAQFGAPAEIRYLAKPHIGTDQLRVVVAAIRHHLEQKGFAVSFRQRLSDLACCGDRLTGVVVNDRDERPCDLLVLAPGHSARDTYAMLLRRQVQMVQKPFAVGLRVEHPQQLISQIQYGANPHPQLPPADYALTYNNPASHRSAYSFCMCPGGVVVAAASEEGGVVTNGMSNRLRNSPYANSALVVGVNGDDFGDRHPLAGIEFQRQLERKAYLAGGSDYRAPAQNLLAFLSGKEGGMANSSYRPGVREAELASILPAYVVDTLREGIRSFERRMRGFITAEATLIGTETRTSAPVRILRGDDLQSVSLIGLYPAGEGAGHAGGIMSAALDGVRVADAIALKMRDK